MESDWTEFQQAYERYDTVHKAFIEMCHDAIAGKGDIPPDVAAKITDELKRLHADFLKAGEPFVRTGRRMY